MTDTTELQGLPMPAISRQIWDMKYRFKNPTDGGFAFLDNTVQATFYRVSRALAQPEKPEVREQWANQFYDAMAGFKFLPAGRIIAGAGTGRGVTLFNCFVMREIPDSMDGIFDVLKESAMTLRMGGGIGLDFSSIRPKGAVIKGLGSDASGPLSFMDIWVSMCKAIMSAGSRRGAMMATMRCDHPDIEAFVDVKRDPSRMRMFNLSVLATEAFMQAVDHDADWKLVFGGKVYKTIRARDLWDRIMQATYDVAEPGVIFIDRVNFENKLSYCETLISTNPCGEAPLPANGNCLLGSINLAAFVRKPFTIEADIDTDELISVVMTAVRMLDNVIDVSGFALPSQKEEALAKRRMGLGITGLADTLAMLGIKYGSSDAVQHARIFIGIIQQAALAASIKIAADKESFPMFDPEAYLAQPAVDNLPDSIKSDIKRHGIRNPILTSIAPTGTISMFAHNVSSGLEPIFALGYWRAVLQNDGSRVANFVESFSLRLFRQIHGIELPAHFQECEGQPVDDMSTLPMLDLDDIALPDGVTWPESFITVADLEPEQHLAMQAAVQKHTCQSISKTINLPASISFEAFKDVYRMAYDSGCKGCTTYRPNDVTGSVLSTGSSTKTKPVDAPAVPSPALPKRPESLPSRTTQFKWPACDHAFYVTIADIVDEDGRRPFEIFVATKNPEYMDWVTGVTRLISAQFRRGGDVEFVARELQETFDPRGGVAWVQRGAMRRPIKSILGMIGWIIERHLQDIENEWIFDGKDSDVIVGDAGVDVLEAPAPVSAETGPSCPSCSSLMVMSGGCATCTSCGHSKCG